MNERRANPNPIRIDPFRAYHPAIEVGVLACIFVLVASVVTLALKVAAWMGVVL